MDSSRIRQEFLNFFDAKKHKIVASAPIVVKDDPTLMFTNAGMNPFKDIFLGNREAKDPRVADTQKCLRVSGKHNDLEDVGRDTYHHTMFEMLGNWSFGDYFKPEAIGWAWELLTRVYGVDAERLYATIFEGSPDEGLSPDEAAVEEWSKYVPEERILPFGKKDNFWEMGETGPCGPCSEIHIDLRSDEERKKTPGAELVNRDHPEVIEVWNLVFIQFNRKKDGSLHKLPAEHVDTGMGFERLCMVLQGKISSYDTDLFSGTLGAVEKLTGHRYGAGQETDMAFRVIVDHIRAIVFTIADGQLPSNVGAGYVVRRILRRAVRYAYTHLDHQDAFLHTLVPILAEQYKEVFPEVVKQLDLIQRVIHEEENAFLRTLGSGMKRWKLIREEMAGAGSREVPGRQVFELYDTYGFPIDLTRLMAREEDLAIDEAGVKAEMQKQKSRSKDAAAVDQEDWVVVAEDAVQEFVGYDQTSADVRLTRYRKVKAKGKEFYHLIFNLTPFYAEGGGQVGDTGVLTAGSDKVRILNTTRENERFIHIADRLPADLQATYTASVDADRRLRIMFNHSATHLLHAGLREVLGDHVQQKGSLVAADHLRFDFSHFSKVEEEELAQIETLVNDKIRANIALNERRQVPFQEALKSGAMALFGEKYGDVVRMIVFDADFSQELCGGTHVDATGQIGFFKIISESSIAAGVRRIEALTGPGAMDYVDTRLKALQEIGLLVKNTKDIRKGVENMAKENQKLRKELERMTVQQVSQARGALKAKVEKIGTVNYIGEIVELQSPDAVKNLAFSLGREIENLFLVLGSKSEQKAIITVMIDKDLVKAHNLNAGSLIKDISKHIRGGGGGQPHFATAGGSLPEGLASAIEESKRLILGQLPEA